MTQYVTSFVGNYLELVVRRVRLELLVDIFRLAHYQIFKLAHFQISTFSNLQISISTTCPVFRGISKLKISTLISSHQPIIPFPYFNSFFNYFIKSGIRNFCIHPSSKIKVLKCHSFKWIIF